MPFTKFVFVALLLAILSVFYHVKIVWLYLNGRWHIFRELPDWYVKSFMRTNMNREESEHDILAQAARDEMRLRGRRRYLGYNS